MKQKKPFEGPRFKVKIIPADLEKIKQGESYSDSLHDFWDPIQEVEEVISEADILELLLEYKAWIDPDYSSEMSESHYKIDSKAFLAARDYRGEKTVPIYPEYNCRIPIKWFQRFKFNETTMNYRANIVEYGHITNKSVLVRSSLEYEIDDISGSYNVEDNLSEQDMIDFLTVNFLHLKGLISLETDYNEEQVHRLACMYTAARYVAAVQGYLSNRTPSHWVLVENVEGDLSGETIQEIISMKMEMHQVILATAAEWWVSDFSVGAAEKFPPLLKKMLLDLPTLRPIFKDFAGSNDEMQKIIHKAIHFVDRRNVLKAIHMEDPAWTGLMPVGLPVIKKVDVLKLASAETLDVLRRVPAGYTSYGNCYKVIEIMKAYKLSKFIYEKKEAELLRQVLEEVKERPNYYHINCSYLNESDKRFEEPKRYYKTDIREIVLECAIFLLFTKCHIGLLKSPFFGSFFPGTWEGILKICPYWLALLHDFIRDKGLIEQAKSLGIEEEERKDVPFSDSIRAYLMRKFASDFKIRSGYLSKNIWC